MSLYARRVLPWLIDRAMRAKAVTEERARIVPLAAGVVLEVGVGSGLNLPFYGADVRRLHALDPSPALLDMARRRGRTVQVPIEWVEGSAEAIPLADGVADTVVTTWTLCSIPDPARALREMRRVLAPGGRLLFIEHGRAPGAVGTWQTRLTPLWRRVSGGCHLDRQIDVLIAAGGFAVDTLSVGYGVGPRPFAYLYRGIARPAASGPGPVASAGATGEARSHVE
jgi:SAM-dependent methyltransferase